MFFVDANVWEDRGELIALIGLVTVFGLSAAWCFAEYFLTRGTFDAHGIRLRWLWLRPKSGAWDELETAYYSASMGWHVLEFRSGVRIRISILMHGQGGVLRLLEEKGVQIDER
ncbi:MAG: hypothetical protein AAF184_23875 [Pseudomonadota bacterium]